MAVTLDTSGEDVFKRKVSTRGQTSLPKPMRTSLGIRPGDYVEFVEVEPGRWVVRRSVPDDNPFADAVGCLKDHRKVDLDADDLVTEMRGPVSPHAVEDDEDRS